MPEDLPFQIFASFEGYFQKLAEIRDHDPIKYRADYAASLLQKASEIPALSGAFNDFEILRQQRRNIEILLADIFPKTLTDNEIKTAQIPFFGEFFNPTNRFQKIIENAGVDFKIRFRNISDEEMYIFCCSLILQKVYGIKLMVSLPLYYDIPDKNGIIRHYKITVNSDFTTLEPTESAPKITSEAIGEMLQNMENLAVWKKYFPKNSWILKGFNIISLVDSTTEMALSDLKSALLKVDRANIQIEKNIIEIFRSYFDAPELSFGMMLFDKKRNRLEKVKLYENLFTSHILDFWLNYYDEQNLQLSFKEIQENPRPAVVNDISIMQEDLRGKPAFEALQKHHIQSFMVMPIVGGGQLLGVVEFTSPIKNCLNSLKLKRLEFLADILVYTIQRFNFEKENQIESIIQQEYTSIHESVAWKFRAEAEKKHNALLGGRNYALKQIRFQNLAPLFAQTDIRASSELRRNALFADIILQIETLISIFSKINSDQASKLLLALEEFSDEFKNKVQADGEIRFRRFVATEIHPFLNFYLRQNPDFQNIIENYFANIPANSDIFYINGKIVDDATMEVSTKLSDLLKKCQKKAQKIFPHYFQMLRTDGVEHDLFIGKSIAPNLSFSAEILSQLKIWQLETVCKMENAMRKFSKKLPISIEVASFIFVYGGTIGIRFRMDEKRFDVDGAVNSSYEIIKKRLEKAHVKNSAERLSQPGRLTVVYMDAETEQEYLQYLQILQQRKLISKTIEFVEVEDLQGVTGLKAMRFRPN